MGKKSRRQREKDPRGTGLRKVLRHALTADTPLSNLSPQELKKLANDVLDSQDPELAQASAMMSLRAALTIDKNDLENFDAYMEIVEPSISAHDKLLKAMKRWPRYRKYWPRIRRRICWGCGKQYALSEPRIWVCGGCGEARYCNAACQRAHWPKHKGPCLQTYEYGSGF